MKLTY